MSTWTDTPPRTRARAAEPHSFLARFLEALAALAGPGPGLDCDGPWDRAQEPEAGQ